ncbi:MAG: crossover junction endodeoxyribonuclease RuvC [Myxococcota bacterium]
MDPGSHHTGWGLVESRGNRLHYPIAASLPSQMSLSQRLLGIADGLDALIQRLSPHRVCVEAVFHHKNSQSALRLGHARGAILLCLARAGLEVCEFTPAEIKRAVTGSGRADKGAGAAHGIAHYWGVKSSSLSTPATPWPRAICLLHAAPAAPSKQQLSAQPCCGARYQHDELTLHVKFQIQADEESQ